MNGDSTILTYEAGVGVNLAGSEGLIVRLTGVSTQRSRGVVTLAADSVTPLLGVITHAEDVASGLVSVCVSGICEIRAGAILAPEGAIGADATSRAVAIAAGSGLYRVGYISPQSGIATQVGGLYECRVDPDLVAVS